MSIYRDAQTLYDRFGTATGDHALPPIQLPHFPIFDTALAACLGTLGVPFREPAPFTDDIEEETGIRRTCFWMSDCAPGEDPASQHKTEELIGAWLHPERFEREHPLHPLASMRAALEAREWWVDVIKQRRAIPAEPKRTAKRFSTDSIHAASILKACGFEPLAFSGRAFSLSPFQSGMHAEALLATASVAEGASPPQWMSRVLSNYSHLLKIAKSQSPIIRLRDGDSTLLLTADSTRKTRDKFHALL